LTVLGTPGRVAGRGYAIEGDHLRVDRAAGTATVDGPGKMWLPVAMAVTDPEEQGPRPPAQGQTETAEITWRGDMRFDGIQAVLTGEVTAVTSQQRGKADTVTVTLARKVDFLRLRQPGDVNVREFDLQGNVFFSSSTTDGQRTQAVDRMWLKNLHVDMHSGDMQSRGAGRVRSVRRQQGRSPLASLGGDQAAAKRSSERTTASQPSDPLFVGVTFERGLTGNIHRREATFHGNVRTVVGHVQDFDDVLDPMAAGGLKEDQMVITCDRLKAADMTRHAVRPGKLDTRPMGPLEIEALGGTHVEGRTFSAWAQRLSYAQAKDLLLMEGSGRALAEIHHQPRPGGPTSKYTAERLLFWPKSGKMEGDIRSLDVNNPDSAREPAP